jgi:hypothetical protein
VDFLHQFYVKLVPKKDRCAAGCDNFPPRAAAAEVERALSSGAPSSSRAMRRHQPRIEIPRSPASKSAVADLNS